MKIFCKCRESLRKAYCKIHLIDKCLIIIMFLLLLQSSYSLFSGTVSSGTVSSEIGTIDIIIRTASASIFGYFLSSNFMRQAEKDPLERNDDRKAAVVDSQSSDEDKNEMTGQDSEDPLELENISFTPTENNLSEPYRDSHLQIIITTAIAIVCLIVLTVFRNITVAEAEHFTASAQATISQFRDLISGCIGFLIGVPTTKK